MMIPHGEASKIVVKLRMYTHRAEASSSGIHTGPDPMSMMKLKFHSSLG